MTNTIKTIITIIAALLLNGCGSATEATTGTVIEKYKNASYTLDIKDHRLADFNITEFVELINADRAAGATCGDHYYGPTSPLSTDGRLMTSSLKKSYDLAMSENFSHDGSGTQYDEFKEGTYAHFAKMIRNEMGRVKGVGENIAYGFVDAVNLHEAFMASPGHCKNVMNSRFDLIGISAYKDNNGDVYWAEHFATAQ